MVGLTVLMHSCAEKPPSLSVLQTKTIAFPSASAIECYNNRLYVFGDDAAYLLVLSTDYRPLDSVYYTAPTTGRISKDVKYDLESAVLLTADGQPCVMALGSYSTPTRRTAVRFFPATGLLRSGAYFADTVSFRGVKALNLEGSCAVGNTLVLANRANLANPENHLLFYKAGSAVVAKPIRLPKTESVAGVSGLFYLPQKDLLLFTASEEATASTTADGAIGESYLGGIKNVSGKMAGKEFKPDFFLKLVDFDKRFRQQKIESVCVESFVEDELLLHLAADNDDGSSQLFKGKLSIF